MTIFDWEIEGVPVDFGDLKVDIQKVARGEWIPPIKNHIRDEKLSIEQQYEALAIHHKEETELLMKAARMLAIQLKRKTS